ncbi:hypothetical protein HK405_004731, partial [Cladochytrium tenue]
MSELDDDEDDDNEDDDDEDDEDEDEDEDDDDEDDDEDDNNSEVVVGGRELTPVGPTVVSLWAMTGRADEAAKASTRAKARKARR